MKNKIPIIKEKDLIVPPGKKPKKKTMKMEMIDFLNAAIKQVEQDQKQARKFINFGNDRLKVLRFLLEMVKKRRDKKTYFNTELGQPVEVDKF